MAVCAQHTQAMFIGWPQERQNEMFKSFDTFLACTLFKIDENEFFFPGLFLSFLQLELEELRANIPFPMTNPIETEEVKQRFYLKFSDEEQNNIKKQYTQDIEPYKFKWGLNFKDIKFTKKFRSSYLKFKFPYLAVRETKSTTEQTGTSVGVTKCTAKFIAITPEEAKKKLQQRKLTKKN